MEALQIKIQTVTSPRNHQPQFMTFFFSSRLRPNPKSCFTYPHLRAFFSAASAPSTNPISTLRSRAVRVRVGVSDAQLKENWLASLSCPFPQGTSTSTSTATYVGHGGESNGSYSASNWVIGVDPDVSGALALLKGDDSADSAQGWWSGGFGYGMWIGILVALGFSVVPVPSLVWKRKFELSGTRSSKDDSRRVASSLFPLLSSSLKRKKDHGRAEALLIAAYGKDMEMKLDSSLTLEKIVS